MKTICHFQIPGEPVGKGRPRITTRGGSVRSYTPAKTASYESLTIAAFRNSQHDGRIVESPVEVQLVCQFAMPRSWSAKKREAMDGGWCMKKPDADNVAKAVCDALNGVLWRDDAQVVRLSVDKRWCDEGGAVTVYVFEASQ